MTQGIIEKAATDLDSFRQPTFFYGSAREGFLNALESLLDPTNQVVLLPAFIGWSPREGSGVFDPIEEIKAEPAFYELNRDLTVNLEWFEVAIAKIKPKIVVVIHYFGRTDPNIRKIGELAKRHGAILMEDLAHGFFSSVGDSDAGRVGDFSIFSLHKMFPSREGGMVRYRLPQLVSGQKGTAANLAELIQNYDWQSISARRRSNFDAVLSELHSIEAIETHVKFLWPKLNGGDVPQSLPVRLLTVDRDEIYHAMNADGFGMTSLYHTMIKDVQEGFPQMTALSASIINFPVHQDMHPAQAKGMVRSFENALSKSLS